MNKFRIIFISKILLLTTNNILSMENYNLHNNKRPYSNSLHTLDQAVNQPSNKKRKIESTSSSDSTSNDTSSVDEASKILLNLYDDQIKININKINIDRNKKQILKPQSQNIPLINTSEKIDLQGNTSNLKETPGNNKATIEQNGFTINQLKEISLIASKTHIITHSKKNKKKQAYEPPAILKRKFPIQKIKKHRSKHHDNTSQLKQETSELFTPGSPETNKLEMHARELIAKPRIYKHQY